MSIIVSPRGGFGNILFNVLIGYSFSKKYGMPVFFIHDYQDWRPNIKKYKIFKTLLYLNRKIIINKVFKDRDFGYTPIEITNTTNNYLLDGYFQTYKYSLEYISDIKKQLYNNIPEIIANANNFMKNIVGVPIALHVRRGDYFQHPTVHPVQPESYYKTAIKHILEHIGDAKYTLLIFSDDIPWVSNWNLLKSYNYVVVDQDVETCFVLMSMCHHFIIANSSLSLSAYYFRENRDTAAMLCLPQKWFEKDGPKYDLNDLIPDPKNTLII